MASDNQDRTVGSPGICDTSHSIGDAWSRSQNSTADTPWVETTVGIGRVNRSLFVTNEDYDTLLARMRLLPPAVFGRYPY